MNGARTGDNMVDFTKRISNEQMTMALKRLLALNEDLANQCENLSNEQSDPGDKARLASLADMHHRHCKALADSLLYLGAAPDNRKRANRRNWFPRLGRGVFGGTAGFESIQTQERKLRQACVEELERLSASDEVVNVINPILAETDQALRTLDR